MCGGVCSALRIAVAVAFAASSENCSGETYSQHADNYFFEHNNVTVEGINTIKVVHEIAANNNIEMPIINGLYKSFFEKVKPSTIINMLMERPLKEEKH